MTESKKCIVCGSDADFSKDQHGTIFNCPRCGNFCLGDIGDADIEALEANKKTVLSHVIRRKPETHAFTITQDVIDNLTSIRPAEVANNLILYLGKNQKSSGEPLCIDNLDEKKKLYALIGIHIEKEDDNFNYIKNSLAKLDIILPEKDPQLTFIGWQKYEELKRSVTNSKKAFMAMKFPEKSTNLDPPYEELRKFYEAAKEEIKKIGYELSNPLLENPQAGLIDARLEREIRDSRFIVADLSHGNQGAYWEAGLAYGLSKPVFYTCKKGVETHFDANHHTTIVWDPAAKEDKAAETLRDTIANTILD